MAERSCSIDDCGKPVQARGWCFPHYQRWRRHGDPLGESAKHPKGDDSDGTCGVGGCARPSDTRGWCVMHYTRLLRDGDVGPPEPREGMYRIINSFGYVALKEPDHPLAQPSTGRVLEHRKILYEHLGPGAHPCHWCGEVLTWDDGLATDHLDFDRANNDLANIVPSCLACNSRRQERWLTGD